MMKQSRNLILSLGLLFTAMAMAEGSAEIESPAIDIDNSTVKNLITSAEQGDPDAQFFVGALYAYGEGVDQDFYVAAEWLKRSAHQGVADAQYMLGDLYSQGLGVPLDHTAAFEWFRKAAEQGLPPAQFSLGSAYSRGFGVAQDDSEAAKWFRKAAEQGQANAQLHLGASYFFGHGVEPDIDEALKWTRRAADQNLPDAQHLLGTVYDEGRGVRQDYAEAVKWYRKAAEQGQVRAQVDLGLMLVDGIGVEQDIAEAYKWFLLAAEAGDYQASEQALLAHLQLTSEERKKAEQDALSWRGANPLRNLAPAGNSQQEPRAEVLDSGICVWKVEESVLEVPESKGTVIADYSGPVVTESASLVPLELGAGFGFHWVAGGLPPVVDLIYIVEHPLITRPDGTQSTLTETTMVEITSNGTVDFTDCYFFEEEYEMVAGQWSISVVVDGVTLAKETYQIVRAEEHH